jgi:hypothetical protein
MTRLRRFTICWLSGFSFWLPSIIVHAIRGNQFGSGPFDIIVVIVLPAVTAVLALGALLRRRPEGFSRYSTALWLLLGIWMLGSLCTMIGASFSGGGFTQPGTWRMVLLGTVTVVPFTFMASTYDGTLGALGIVTICLFVIAIKDLAIRWSKRAKARHLA